MSSKELVLVTGASGFVGAQVVEHLLDADYAVRGTSRTAKADALRKNCDHPDFEVVIIDDLVAGNFSEALKGVKSVLHIASPLASGSNHIEVAVDGTLNLLRQAHMAKVYKITILSSFAATANFTGKVVLFDPSRVINDQDWSTVTKEEALRPGTDSFSIYAASKALAERAVWEFGRSHPEMDLVTILPPFIYGPMAPGQVILGPSQGLSTNRFIYLLISGETAAYPPMLPPQCVDVRDVAKACVLSLRARPANVGERRRILLWGGSFTWKQAAHHIAVVRPELKSRLVDGGEVVVEELPCASINTSQAKDVLGMSDFVGWKQSVEDAVDSLIQRECMWTE